MTNSSGIQTAALIAFLLSSIANVHRKSDWTAGVNETQVGIGTRVDHITRRPRGNLDQDR